MKVFAITGLLASGKTTAANYLKEQGFPILDIDNVSKIVIDKNTEEGKDGFAKVYRAFGSGVLDKLGNLDRGALRKRLAVNPHEKEVLENIMNPLMHNYVRKVMTQWKSDNIQLGFFEGARIFEPGFDKIVAGVIRVTASENERIKRMVKRDSMGKDEVTAMITAQHPGMFDRFCKVEWKNDKSLANLYKQIDAFVEQKLAEGV